MHTWSSRVLTKADVPLLTLPGSFCSVRFCSSSRETRFYGILNSLGLLNKNAKILFLVSCPVEIPVTRTETCA